MGWRAAAFDAGALGVRCARRASIFVLLAACSAPMTVGEDGGMQQRRDAPPIRLPDAQSIPVDAPIESQGPYPIVLAHGFFGFETFAGADFITYFYGVRDHLRANGETEVYTPAVDPFADSATRGAQLLAHVQQVLAETGAAKVNLIGHSQGGLDARWVAHERPDLVASVTTISTPHYGTPISDIVLGIVSDDRLQQLADALVRAIGRVLWDAAGNETSVFAGLRQFSTPGITAFNEAYPNVPGIAYYSIAGRSANNLGNAPCEVTGSPRFMLRYGAMRDPVDPLLAISATILGGDGGTVPNDGLVRVSDARWGHFLGCIPADHIDEVGQLFGDSPGCDFEYLAFYDDLVAWLRAQGH